MESRERHINWHVYMGFIEGGYSSYLIILWDKQGMQMATEEILNKCTEEGSIQQ